MKERPILFSGPMVRAILEGRKTQTRRIAKRISIITCDDRSGATDDRCPYGVPGDRLWVRENAIPDPPLNGWDGDVEWDGCGRPWGGVPVQYRSHAHVLYQASWTGSDIRWRPSIHMPRWASRLTLEVVSVRVERLQNISDGDARAEGVASIDEYAHLWDKINGVGAWALNPWVWVIEFKMMERA